MLDQADAASSLKEPFNARNTWHYSVGNDCWLYCDGAAYFKAFIHAAERASSHIFILGWDIHTETNLAPDIERSHRSRHWNLDAFLRRLLKTKPQLQIYLLSWDFSPVFFLEREKLQSLRFAWFSHPHMHFYLDFQHPVGGSQHQKIVVIDDQTAFLGGLDLTIRRWDSCQHPAQHPWRRDPDGEAYAPFHDTQLGMSGPGAQQLSLLFRERWQRATGQTISLPLLAAPQRLPNPWPEGSAACFKQAPVALSRTNPEFRSYAEVREIVQHYTKLIQTAQDFVLIENQYLTAHRIVEAISEVCQRDKGPEFVIILPERSGGWLEIKTMGLLQNSSLAKIFASDPHHRVHVYYPYDQQLAALDQYITVHSKLMLIDQHYLVVGSANLNNRSMGLDTECNATIDGREDPALQREILKTAAFIIAHFSNAEPAQALELLQQRTSLVEVIDRLAQKSPIRHLAKFKVAPNSDKQVSLLDADLLDMEQPARIEIAMDRWGKMSEAINQRLGIGISARVGALLLTGVLALALAAVWTFTPLAEYLDKAGLLGLLDRFKAGEPLTLIVLPLVYAIACLLFFPINLLIIVTASLFPAAWAFTYIALGVVANVGAGYSMGRIAGRTFFRHFFGQKTRKILKRIGEGHFITLVLLRIVPIAPNSVINLAAGAGRIPLLKFMGATLIGMTPGTIMLVLFQKSIIDLFREPSWQSIAILLTLTLTAIFLYRWSRLRFSNYGNG